MGFRLSLISVIDVFLVLVQDPVPGQGRRGLGRRPGSRAGEGTEFG